MESYYISTFLISLPPSSSFLLLLPSVSQVLFAARALKVAGATAWVKNAFNNLCQRSPGSEALRAGCSEKLLLLLPSTESAAAPLVLSACCRREVLLKGNLSRRGKVLCPSPASPLHSILSIKCVFIFNKQSSQPCQQVNDNVFPAALRDDPS